MVQSTGGHQVEVTGAPFKWVSGKDVILHLIGMIGVDGALIAIFGIYRRRSGKSDNG